VAKVLLPGAGATSRAGLRREWEILAALVDAGPALDLVHPMVATEKANVVQSVPGVAASEILRRNPPEAPRIVCAAGVALSALGSIDPLSMPVGPSRSPGFEVEVEVAQRFLPSWLMDQAMRVSETPAPASPVLVHDDFVADNWIWDGERVVIVDLEDMYAGHGGQDTATAWARLQLRDAPWRRGGPGRLAASVLVPPWPPTDRGWLALALAEQVWVEALRARRRPPAERLVRLQVLRQNAARAARLVRSHDAVGPPTYG